MVFELPTLGAERSCRPSARRWLVAAATVVHVLIADAAQPLSSNTPPMSKAALVIGNAHYTFVPPLKNPEHDAQDLCKTLVSINFTTMCITDVPTRARLRAVIQDFVEGLAPDSVVLVYYAGHGVQIEGENYLLPTGVAGRAAGDIARQSMSLSFLFSQLQQAGGFLNVVILDACRSDPFALAGVSLAQGLAQINSTALPKSTEVLYASGANEPALDGPNRNGILTTHLLNHLTQVGEVDDLFKQVSADVQRETEALGHRQEPARYTNFTGHYCLIRCTELQVVQQQQRESELKLLELQARVEAGDNSARAELSKEQGLNAKLQKSAKAAEDRERRAKKITSVVPAF